MQTATRRRTTWAVAASLMAHLAVLTIVALQRPLLAVPQDSAGPPLAIIPVVLMPRVPPAGAARGLRAEIRLHQRLQRTAPNDLPIAPLIAPSAPAPPPASTPPIGTRPPGPSPAEIQQTNVRGALQALVGCANPDAAGLTRAQRARCEERLAAGAKDAPFTGLGLDTVKAAGLATAAAHKEACRANRETAGGEPPQLRNGPC